MDRTGKAQITDAVAKELETAKLVVLSDYTGITVEEVTRLRSQIRAKKGKFKVAKNTLAARAFADPKHAEFKKLLKGMNAITFGYDDPVAVLKVLTDFEKDSNGKIKIRGGLIDGRPATPAELKVIATLPPREVLLGQVVGLIASPISSLLNVLNGTTRKFVYLLKALEEKKGKEAPAEGAPAAEAPAAQA